MTDNVKCGSKKIIKNCNVRQKHYRLITTIEKKYASKLIKIIHDHVKKTNKYIVLMIKCHEMLTISNYTF